MMLPISGMKFYRKEKLTLLKVEELAFLIKNTPLSKMITI